MNLQSRTLAPVLFWALVAACHSPKKETRVETETRLIEVNSPCEVKSETAEATTLECKSGSEPPREVTVKNNPEAVTSHSAESGAVVTTEATVASASYAFAVKNVRFELPVEGKPFDDVICSFDLESESPDLLQRQVLWTIKETSVDRVESIKDSGLATIRNFKDRPYKYYITARRPNHVWLSPGSLVNCEIRLLNKGYNPDKPDDILTVLTSGTGEFIQMPVDRIDIAVASAYAFSQGGASHKAILRQDKTLIAYTDNQPLDKPLFREKNVLKLLAASSNEVVYAKANGIYSLHYDGTQKQLRPVYRGAGIFDRLAQVTLDGRTYTLAISKSYYTSFIYWETAEPVNTRVPELDSVPREMIRSMAVSDRAIALSYDDFKFQFITSDANLRREFEVIKANLKASAEVVSNGISFAAVNGWGGEAITWGPNGEAFPDGSHKKHLTDFNAFYSPDIGADIFVAGMNYGIRYKYINDRHRFYFWGPNGSFDALTLEEQNKLTHYGNDKVIQYVSNTKGEHALLSDSGAVYWNGQCIMSDSFSSSFKQIHATADRLVMINSNDQAWSRFLKNWGTESNPSYSCEWSIFGENLAKIVATEPGAFQALGHDWLFVRRDKSAEYHQSQGGFPQEGFNGTPVSIPVSQAVLPLAPGLLLRVSDSAWDFVNLTPSQPFPGSPRMAE